MSNVYPGQFSTFVPEAQKELQSNYTQNPEAFALNKYVTVAPVGKSSGYYIVHDPDEATRLVYADGADMLWADGGKVPDNMRKGHDFTQYTTKRYARGFTIGDLAQAQAAWDVVADHAQDSAMGLMTLRASLALTAALASSNTSSCSSLSGGKWDASSAALQYIRKGIQAGIQLIHKATNGVVKAKDLQLVISPDTAQQMSSNAEMVDYVKSSPFALSFMQSNEMFDTWGLPATYAGVQIVVEDAVKNTARKGAVRAASYILEDDALLVARPGALVGQLNTMSGITLAMYEDVKVKIMRDDFNELTQGAVADNYAVIIRDALCLAITDVCD